MAAVTDTSTEVAPPRPDSAVKEKPQGSFLHRHPRAKWLILGAAALIAVGAYFVWSYYSTRESTDDAQINGHIIPISARVSGFVEQVMVEENQQVKAGTVLCRIDPAEYRIAVEHAEADLSDAQASAKGAHTTVPITSVTAGSQLANAQGAAQVARAGIDTAQRQINAARAEAASRQARLRQAESDYQNASQDLTRYQQLVAKDDISRQQYDAAVTKVNTTRASVDAARAGVTAAQQSIAVAESNLTEAKARAGQAAAEVRSAGTAPQQVAVTEAKASSATAKVLLKQAALDQAKLNLQYTVVAAPVDGVVGERDVEPGMNVQVAQPLLSIVPLNDIWATANFKESELRRMRPGQKAIIAVDSYGGRKYDGYVESIAPATGEKFSLLPPENATGNYVKVVQRIPVRLRLNHGQDRRMFCGRVCR